MILGLMVIFLNICVVITCTMLRDFGPYGIVFMNTIVYYFEFSNYY